MTFKYLNVVCHILLLINKMKLLVTFIIKVLLSYATETCKVGSSLCDCGINAQRCDSTSYCANPYANNGECLIPCRGNGDVHCRCGTIVFSFCS